jgi:3-oxoacyl-[acyl-carrier protein] reductase
MLLVKITSMMEPDDKSGWVPNQLIWESAVSSYQMWHKRFDNGKE